MLRHSPDIQRTFVIAEAGVNHNGDLKRALQLVDAAVAAGADAVKFQSYKTEALVAAAAPKADYQLQTTSSTESQFEMLKRLELSEANHTALYDHCRKGGIEFLSTPFDLGSLVLLSDKMGLQRLKLPSGELNNPQLLLAAGRTGKKLIVSTGMSYLSEVEAALGVIAFGMLGTKDRPSQAAFREAFRSQRGQDLLQAKVSILHCTTEYPAADADINLRAMDTLRAAFGLPVGLSDHSAGIAVPLAAVGRGASIIEKHFTLDRNLPGPDHRASLEPGELISLVKGIRAVEAALGSSLKAPVDVEMQNAPIAKKVIVAATKIAKGSPLTEQNITLKRLGKGASASLFFDVLGRTADRDYAPDEPITF